MEKVPVQPDIKAGEKKPDIEDDDSEGEDKKEDNNGFEVTPFKVTNTTGKEIDYDKLIA